MHLLNTGLEQIRNHTALRMWTGIPLTSRCSILRHKIVMVTGLWLLDAIRRDCRFMGAICRHDGPSLFAVNLLAESPVSLRWPGECAICGHGWYDSGVGPRTELLFYLQ